MKNLFPVGSLVEEVNFNLAGGATREGVIIDTADWLGGHQAQYAATRKSGFPLLDLAIYPPGAVQVHLRYAVNTTPAAAPTLTWHDLISFGVGAASWGVIEGQRLSARFAQIQIEDTSGAANNGIHLVYFLRGQ